MKIAVWVSLVLVSFSCSVSQKKEHRSPCKSEFYIEKIQTRGSWFVIYAVHEDTVFKIVSGASQPFQSGCQKIKVGSCYKLEISPIKNEAPVINGAVLRPVNYLDVECFDFDSKTSICIEPEKGIFYLYKSKNSAGLCLVEE